MSIITFWNDNKEQTGKTLVSVAVATRMAIERNFKVLLISTGYKDNTMKRCFWSDNEKKKKDFQFGRANISVESGIEGLTKLINANKIQPTIITDYTKVIFRDRLEILSGYVGAADRTDDENLQDYKNKSECYPDLIKLASQAYDMVIVDLDNRLSKNVKQEILEVSNLNLLVMTQRLSSLNNYNTLKMENKEILGPKCMPVIGKYDKNSKYNKKNMMRYLDEKKELNIVPYNTLFFEAAEEANVTELFLKLRNIKDTTDDNYFFMSEVLKLINNILTRLQDLQMKTR